MEKRPALMDKHFYAKITEEKGSLSTDDLEQALRKKLAKEKQKIAENFICPDSPDLS